jgi:hypothetical protein
MREWRYSSILDPALDGGERSASRPGRFTPGERAPGTNEIGDSVGPRTCLDAVEYRKTSFPAGNQTPAAKPAVYRSTD